MPSGLWGGGCSRLWNAEPAHLMPPPPQSIHLLHAELLAECTRKSPRLPSADLEVWEALGHGHCVQTALPPTFLTHHAKQEASGGCFFVFPAVNTAAALPRSPAFANFRQGALLFQTKASGAQACSGVD